MKKIVFARLLVVFCFAFPIFAQETSPKKSYKIEGVLKDRNDARFAGLPLYFNKEGKSDWTSSDVNGHFSIELEIGSYKVTVNPTVSAKFVAYIEIRDNALNPNNIEFTIEMNAFCCGDSSDILYPKVLTGSKPVYPPAAKAVRTAGEVLVNVKIDKDGKVIFAQAERGHPLLKRASEIASKQWVFESSQNSEERNAKLTFVFIFGEGIKKELKHYSNPYRLEVIAEPATLDY